MEILRRNLKINRAELVLFTVIVVTIMAAIMLWRKVPTYGTFIENKSEEQIIPDMWTGTTVEQEFTCFADWEFITLDFSDHDLYIDGKVIFEIKQQWDGTVINYVEINSENIRYGTPVKLYANEGGKAGKCYILTILTPKAPDSRGLGLYGFAPETGQPTCKINDQKSEYAVSIGIHMSTLCYRVHFLLIVILLVIMFSLCTFFTMYKKGKTETLFLCIAVPMGIIFLSFLNVNIVHDGGTHLTNVYKYSNKLVGRSGQDSLEYVYLSQDEIKLREETDNFYILMRMLGDKRDRNAQWQPYFEQRPTLSDSILEYFPGVFGITLGRILGVNAMGSVLLAKLFCLSFYIMFCYLAIRITPILKEGFAVTALIPMNLYQAAGITYDAVVTPVAYFVLAIIFKGRERKIEKREWMCLLFSSMILGSCKGGAYIPVLLLLVFIHAEVNGGKRFKIGACLMNWLVAAATLLLHFKTDIAIFFSKAEAAKDTLLASGAADDMSWLTGSQIPKFSLRYLLINPFGFVNMVIRTIVEKADYYLGSMIGNRMAWTDEETSWIIISFFLILLVLSTAWNVKEQFEKIKPGERVLSGLLLMGELVGLHAIMLAETRINQIIIFGVQGRYFLPLIPILMFMLFSKSRMKTDVETGREFRLLSVAEIMYVFSFIMIVYK